MKDRLTAVFVVGVSLMVGIAVYSLVADANGNEYSYRTGRAPRTQYDGSNGGWYGPNRSITWGNNQFRYSSPYLYIAPVPQPYYNPYYYGPPAPPIQQPYNYRHRGCN